MSQFSRFAVFAAPPPGPLAEFAACWLGWDAATAKECPHPEPEGLPMPVRKITKRPRKYGFHGTLKPPFTLVDGTSPEGLRRDLATLAARLSPVPIPGLHVAPLGRLLALRPQGDCSALSALAAEVVRSLDPHRRPATQAELNRRRAAPLTPDQDALLVRWGCPFVMDEFRFHLTLTGPLSPDEMTPVQAYLQTALAPMLPPVLMLQDLCLFGESARDGRFQLIERVALRG